MAQIASGAASLVDPATGKAIESTPLTRAAALAWLGRHRPPQALAVLTAALWDADPAVREAAVKGLLCLGDPAAAVPLGAALLAPLAVSPSPAPATISVSYPAIDMDDPSLPMKTAVKEIPWREDPDLAWRCQIARVLADLGAEEGVAPLVEALEKEKENACAELATACESSLEILANLSFKADQPGIVERSNAWRRWWEDHKSEPRAVWVLAGFREHDGEIKDLESKAAAASLVKFLAVEQPWLRANAAERLMRLAHETNDPARLASLLDLFREIVLRAPESPASGADPVANALAATARRQFARVFHRTAWRYAEIKKMTAEAFPPGAFVAGFSLQAPQSGLENPVEALAPLAAWWARARQAQGQ